MTYVLWALLGIVLAMAGVSVLKKPLLFFTILALVLLITQYVR